MCFKTVCNEVQMFAVKKQKKCVMQGTLLSAMWQPGWEGSLGENG